MQVQEFALERIQSLYENTVEINLSDSGVHPQTLRELLSEAERESLLDLELGYGWTNGAVALREAIARLYPGRTADEVVVTNGSAEANFLMTTSLVEPGDEVVVVVPNYLQIHGWAQAIGAVVREVPLRDSLGWRPDLADLEAAITPRTKLLTLCTPNNPTGAVLDRDFMVEVVALAERHGLWLHADEVYKGSEFAADEPPSFADLYPRAIVTNGLSKAMALPGLRIGWLVGPAAAIASAWACKDYTSITTGAVSEFVATQVLVPARRAAILARSKQILAGNVELLRAWVEAHQAFHLVPPQAGGMAFMRYHFEENSTALAHRLRTTESLLVCPGDVYGMDGYLRLGVGAPRAHVQEGLVRLARATAGTPVAASAGA